MDPGGDAQKQDLASTEKTNSNATKPYVGTVRRVSALVNVGALDREK